MTHNLTETDLIKAFRDIGITDGTTLEVHSSLSSFGYVEGGAETVISALKKCCGESGSIFMPALRLSKNLELTDEDKRLGIITKIKIQAVSGGLDLVIENGGMALLLGVDIYKLTAMHYAEDNLPKEITDIFAPNKEAAEKYPSDKWLIETGEPPVKPWYTIQDTAYKNGLIKDGFIGGCKYMFFRISDILDIYRRELADNPLKLYGLE